MPAARGRRRARYSENLDAIAWYDENSGNETHSVAGKEANSWGLYDMLGNVWEWCADVWVNDYTEKSRAAAAESASAHRVIRGGSWNDDARCVRTAYRNRYGPSDRNHDLGFRCAEFRAGRERGEGERRARRRVAEPRGDRDPARPGTRAGEASSSAGNRLHEPDRCRQRRAKDADRGARGGS